MKNCQIYSCVLNEGLKKYMRRPINNAPVIACEGNAFVSVCLPTGMSVRARNLKNYRFGWLDFFTQEVLLARFSSKMVIRI